MITDKFKVSCACCRVVHDRHRQAISSYFVRHHSHVVSHNSSAFYTGSKPCGCAVMRYSARALEQGKTYYSEYRAPRQICIRLSPFYLMVATFPASSLALHRDIALRGSLRHLFSILGVSLSYRVKQPCESRFDPCLKLQSCRLKGN